MGQNWTDGEEVFSGRAPDRFIKVWGKVYFITPRCLNVKIKVVDLDKNGNPQFDEDGNLKVKVLTKNIQSVEIWKPKDVPKENV